MPTLPVFVMRKRVLEVPVEVDEATRKMLGLLSVPAATSASLAQGVVVPIASAPMKLEVAVVVVAVT